MPKVLPEYLAARRKQIIEAAGECFNEKGFHQTSMQDICERSELSPGAVYRYFKGKDEIIQAIVEDAHERNLELIESIKTGGDTAEVLEELAYSFLGALSDDQVRLHLDMLSEAPRSERVRSTLLRGFQAINESFAGFIRSAQERGDVSRDVDPEAMARVMCALYNGYIAQQQIDPDASPEAFIQAVMLLFDGGYFTDKTAALERLGRRTRAPA